VSAQANQNSYYGWCYEGPLDSPLRIINNIGLPNKTLFKIFKKLSHSSSHYSVSTETKGVTNSCGKLGEHLQNSKTMYHAPAKSDVSLPAHDTPHRQAENHPIPAHHNRNACDTGADYPLTGYPFLSMRPTR